MPDDIVLIVFLTLGGICCGVKFCFWVYAHIKARFASRPNKATLLSQNKQLLSEYMKLSKENELLQSKVQNLLAYDVRNTIARIENSNLFSGSPLYASLHNLPPDACTRIRGALSDNLSFSSQINATCEITGSSGVVYTTSLTHCSCPDFQSRKIPCKHMYYLAATFGLFQTYDPNEHKEALLSYIDKKETASVALKKAIDAKKDLNKLLKENSQRYPWLSRLTADMLCRYDDALASKLRNKSNPALRASEHVKRINQEKRELLMENKQLSYQLNFYETVFPWLEEFKELPPVLAYKQIVSSDDPENEYESLRNFLSPSEYSNLSPSQKYQLALDRYDHRKKTNWDAGIEYERYVRYQYEQLGYKVRFNGAVSGVEDMGRDLLAENDTECLVIQCKRWSQDKTIHEKHIFQLFGSTVLLSLSEKKKKIRGVFITSTMLSQTARDCAAMLNIEIKENLPLSSYPKIKCNVSSNSGEKIYHLPFDQQYDRVQITGDRGDLYVSTVLEAETLGFRRAYRWHPTQS